nr:MAG TPA: Transcriptional regulator, RHH-like, CopG [Caudoviricetes sp.]
MEPDQFRRLMAYCQREERSISWVIRKALEMFLVCSDT